MRSRHLSLLLVALLLTACAPDVSASPESAEVGSSNLAPSITPEAPHHREHHRDRHVVKGGKHHGQRPQSHPRRKAKRPTPTPTARPVAATTVPPVRHATLTASVGDPAGDVRGSLGSAPSYVDLTGATLTRGPDGYVLRIGFAGAVPAKQGSDGKTVNVASFYDLDGDGRVDHEVWAALADDGWSGSYRYPSGARYGGDSGVTARPEGGDLVVTFPLGHLRRADAFRWSVGAEWGSYAEVAAGTTAHDTAPDSGVTGFPG